MNVETVRRLLTHAHQTCTIRRRTPGSDDAYGEPAKGTYTTLATGVVCMAIPVSTAGRGGEQFTVNTALIYNRYDFYFAGDVSIAEDDQLADLAFRGTPTNTHKFEVLQLLRQQPYYIQAICREVL